MLADSLKNIFAVPDLRKRVLFTLGLLAVYRVGGHVPTPGINSEALALLAEQGVALSATVHPSILRAVTHLGVDDEDLERALEAIPRALGARVGA
jgi:preprotein translocase subunit SecY